MMMTGSNKQSTSLWRSVGLITLAMIALVSVTSIAIDRICYSDLRGDLLVYPNAALISDMHIFLGQSRVVYETSDRAADVEAWYRNETVRILREGVENNQPVSPGWLHRYAIETTEEGTRITFLTYCP